MPKQSRNRIERRMIAITRELERSRNESKRIYLSYQTIRRWGFPAKYQHNRFKALPQVVHVRKALTAEREKRADLLAEFHTLKDIFRTLPPDPRPRPRKFNPRTLFSGKPLTISQMRDALRKAREIAGGGGGYGYPNNHYREMQNNCLRLAMDAATEPARIRNSNAAAVIGFLRNGNRAEVYKILASYERYINRLEADTGGD